MITEILLAYILRLLLSAARLAASRKGLASEGGLIDRALGQATDIKTRLKKTKENNLSGMSNYRLRVE
jgi:hypothetical protein